MHANTSCRVIDGSKGGGGCSSRVGGGGGGDGLKDLFKIRATLCINYAHIQ